MINVSERAKKIRELALRGADGEKEAASALLDKLMLKYGLSSEDIDDDEELAYREVSFKGEEQRALIVQIVYKVTNETDRLYKRYNPQTGRSARSKIEVLCTRAQKAEIDVLFDFYTRLWEKEKAVFLKAFICKHRLFGMLKEGEEPNTLTPETLDKICAMMSGMSDANPLARITDGRAG